MLGVVDEFSQEWLREPLRYLVAVSAVAILVAACNAAMLGVSRLGYSLALNRQIPSRIGYLHPRTSTPVVIIGIAAALAILLLLTADLEFLLGISAFGATAAFTIVCLSVCRLRWKRARPRPPVPDPVQRPRGRRRPAAPGGARRGALRRPRSCPCSRSTAARAGSASAGWRSACCCTSSTACPRTSRC